MWRATVIQQIRLGEVLVRIPDLYRDDPIGPIPSSVEAEPGEQVFVADVAPQSKARALMVVGYQSMIGRWGTAYAHTHPTGQITGLDATGTETTLTEILAAKANLSDIPASQDLSGYVTTDQLSNYATIASLAGYATDTELSTGLSTKVNSSTYTNDMNGKADKPGPWIKVPLDSRLVPDSRSTEIPHADVVFAISNTPLGQQIRGLYNVASTIPAWTLLGTIPDGYGVRPYAIMRPLVSAVMNGGKAMQLNIDRDGTIRNRDEWTTGWVSFDWTAPGYYD